MDEEKKVTRKAPAFVEPAGHIQFISWSRGLEWARHLELPYKSVGGLRFAFKNKGGTYGRVAGAPHRNNPLPVEQFRLFLGGYRIRDSRGKRNVGVPTAAKCGV